MEYGEFVVDVKIAEEDRVGELATARFSVEEPPVDRFTISEANRSLKS
jgi:hypothetical protein